MNADGTQPRRLTHNAQWDEMPAWNPDRTRVAFVRHFHDDDDDYTRTNYSELYVMDTDGTNERCLSRVRTCAPPAPGGVFVNHLTSPRFTADGRYIVYNHNGVIYRIASDGGTPQPLARGVLVDCMPAPLSTAPGHVPCGNMDRGHPARNCLHPTRRHPPGIDSHPMSATYSRSGEPP